MNQAAEILAYLKSGRSLTGLEALGLFGTLKLATRVSELRRAGHAIQSKTVTLGKKRFSEYFISTPTQLEIFK